MREEFEKLPEIKERLDMKCVHFNGKWYATNPHMGNSFATASYLNGAYYAHQEQQKKIDKAIEYLDSTEGLVWYEQIKELLK